jgi:hypothetical protein
MTTNAKPKKTKLDKQLEALYEDRMKGAKTYRVPISVSYAEGDLAEDGASVPGKICLDWTKAAAVTTEEAAQDRNSLGRGYVYYVASGDEHAHFTASAVARAEALQRRFAIWTGNDTEAQRGLMRPFLASRLKT